MKTDILKFIIICFIAFNSCKRNSVDIQKPIFYNIVEVVNDTVLNNGAKIKYLFKEKDNLAIIQIVNNHGVSSIDSYYYEKYDDRMVPNILYSTDNEIFMICGSGFYHRVLYRFEFDRKTIIKQTIPFDIFESDSTEFSCYPFSKNNKLYVLIIDSSDSIKILDVKAEIGDSKIKGISVFKNKLLITLNINEQILINL